MKWFQAGQKGNKPECYGTDPSRNYDNEWAKYGAADTCNEFYAGPKPFSEPETKAMASFLNEHKNDINVK